jgi:acyl transferase domain-containing protein/phosphopantetheinyl transferase (holo-ACP synthase)
MGSEERDIAIVGISVFCPAGESVDEFWDNIVRGGDFVIEAPSDVFDPYHFEGKPNGVDRFYCKRGGFNKSFKLDPLRYGVLPITADAIDPDELISMAAVEQALIDAGVFEKEIPLQDGAIIIGKGNFSGVVPLRSLEIVRLSRQFAMLMKSIFPDMTEKEVDKIAKAYRDRQGRYQPDMAVGTMPNLVASMVANRFDIQGPAYTVDAACASGILAIDHSVTLLRSGRCDIAVAGGMHTGHSPMFWSAFDMLGALSHKDRIAPFSKDADGLLIGQGIGFVVLKTLRKAQEDGDRIYAVIKETAVGSDGAASHVMVTSVAGELRVIRRAWEKAGMDPNILGYVEAHGTATPVGDPIEIMALKDFFGDNTKPQAFVGSVKSNIGHAMSTAGMIGVIKTALALYHRTIPPTLHCEEPLPAMFESRFLPPQGAIHWDGERYPLVAGVNAFGFGGINSHAILTAYEPPVGAPPLPKPKPWLGEAIMVSAPGKDELIEKLERGDYTNTGGDYRIVIFAPDEDRIRKAITIVSKDKPWRGRLDIWFSNQAVLTNGGKIVYLFPGLVTQAASETDTISEIFDLEYMDALLSTQDQREHTQLGMKNFFATMLCMQALSKLGIEADLFAGQSIGEWNAAVLGGMLEGDWNEAYQEILEWDLPHDYPILTIGGVDLQTVEGWCEEIPGVYLASENSPSQFIVTGEREAISTLIERLEKERIFYARLIEATGFHTPLMKPHIEARGGLAQNITVHEGRVPIFSATTLEAIPTNNEEYAELVETQLTRPTYFRSLIDKLYDEQDVRVFIQISPGPVVAFIEETLEGKPFNVIAANQASHGGADQLRRVLATLFVEGREVDPEFLGVKLMYRVERSLLVLPRGLPPIITELPELNEAIPGRYGDIGTYGFGAASTSTDLSGNPLLAVADQNMREVLKAQEELRHLFVQTAQTTFAGAEAEGVAAPDGQVSPEAPPLVPQLKAAPPELPSPFEEPLPLRFEDHPYLVDHSIIRQPPDWPHQEDLNPVVPFAMTLELLAESARRQAPERKIIRVRKATAYRWISLEEPFDGLIKGTWKSQNVLELVLEGNTQTRDTFETIIETHAKAEFVFGDEWPTPPEIFNAPIDVGEKILPELDPQETYERFAFHGPMYHTCKTTTKIGSRGMIGTGSKCEGKGSLLDSMGQQLGLFLHLTQTENTISFPVRLGELEFYNHFYDQEGIFELSMVITRLTNIAITADMYVRRGGTPWCVAHDYVCQRFKNYLPVWNVILKPQYHSLSDEIEPGIYFYLGTLEENALALLSKRYMREIETAVVKKLGSNSLKREYMVSRIALKDAVRNFVRREGEELLYPIEIVCTHDENGKPLVSGEGRAVELLEGVHVSLAHKGVAGVAIAAHRPVGIDLEKIEEKSEGFEKIAFTERERELLTSLKQPEGTIRFWVAKEACSKKAGTGLEGNPKHFEVTAVDGDVLFVGDEKVQTRILREEYVVGWTL